MPQRQQRNQDIRAQYSDIFRWHREQLLARKTLTAICENLPQPEELKLKANSPEGEDERLAFFQGLGQLPIEKYQQVHQNLKQEHDILVNDVRTLHRLLAQPL